MRGRTMIGATIVTAVFGVVVARSAFQSPVVRAVEEKVLREYTGVYRWGPNAFVYLQLWNEFSGFTNPSQLVAFDESGDIRVLFPTDSDRFFAGPGAAVAASIESRIEFQRDATGNIASLTWQREGAAARTARRIEIEKSENVRFSNGDVRLAGTLISPSTGGKHPAIILVHGSGAENRDYILPFARFLVRRGIAVLVYDKRGVGGSNGDWKTASFEDLAGDVVAAFEYLKTRSDIHAARDRIAGREPGRVDHAARGRSCEGPCVPDQHLGRRRAASRDHDRSGAERVDSSRHEAADSRGHRRDHETAVPVRSYWTGLGRVRSRP